MKTQKETIKTELEKRNLVSRRSLKELSSKVISKNDIFTQLNIRRAD